MDPEHVGALNLIDLEFYGRQRVISAFSAYMGHLSAPLPSEEGHDRFAEQREDLMVQLLFEIGRDLGFRYDKHDLVKHSYGPTVWFSKEELNLQNVGLLNDILAGRRALPVTSMQPLPANPYPPTPIVDDATGPSGLEEKY